MGVSTSDCPPPSVQGLVLPPKHTTNGLVLLCLSWSPAPGSGWSWRLHPAATSLVQDLQAQGSVASTGSTGHPCVCSIQLGAAGLLQGRAPRAGSPSGGRNVPVAHAVTSTGSEQGGTGRGGSVRLPPHHPAV